ncbi:TadE/TadG family type IV pilus assembly protein [Tsuneonella sp. HG222]
MTLRRLRTDECGATVVEFALLAPVLVVSLLGLFDMGYNTYTSSVLQGAIAKAARNSAIEGADHTALDSKVEAAVKNIAGNATVTFERKAYSNFSDVRSPEDFSDLNGNGACDAGEPFEDVNGNNSWDMDRGRSGGGGARDAVLYTVRVSYPRAFPIGALIGLSETHQTQSSAVLRNQPYADQNVSAPTLGNCT